MSSKKDNFAGEKHPSKGWGEKGYNHSNGSGEAVEVPDLTAMGAVTDENSASEPLQKHDEPEVDDEIIHRLETRCEELEQELNAERDRYLRLMAEFDNYRKRTRSEINDIARFAAESLIRRLLNPLDDLDRLMADNSGASEALREGLRLTRQKFYRILEEEGVSPIAAVGIEFNADEHEAVATIQDQSQPAGTIVAEVERGYRIGNKILRHSKVVVVEATQSDTDIETVSSDDDAGSAGGES